jgi:hypothetical protein
MKSSIRAALAFGALALASSAASASSVTLSNGSVELVSDTLYQDNPHPAPNTPIVGWMALTVDPGVTGAVFKLADTNTDGYTVDYQLYQADQTTAIGSGWSMQDIGTQLQNLALAGHYEALGSGLYFVKLSFANFDQSSFSASTQVSAVPLPAAAWLFGSALLGLGAMRRKQKAAAKSEMALA